MVLQVICTRMYGFMNPLPFSSFYFPKGFIQIYTRSYSASEFREKKFSSPTLLPVPFLEQHLCPCAQKNNSDYFV